MPKAKRKAKARRRRASRPRARHAIEVALARLAHDIRTPLTGILALSELLTAADLPLRERRWAESIRDSADHLARLTTVVVDAARAEVAGLVLRAEPFSPRDLARSVASSLAARAEAKSLDVAVSVTKGLPTRVSGDEIRLRGALENLIDNAVKFTERGRIRFSASARPAGGGRVRLTYSISDSGIGIVAADLKRLFRPFAQANAEVARRFGGAGLGLVYVKRIAEAMGGDLHVTSRPGRGSTFTLSVQVELAPSAPRKAAAVPRASRPLRVLCVEDNPYGRAVLKAVLVELGHRVGFVGSGEAAIEAVTRSGHDVVIMDVALPGIDGIETTRRIRALPGPAGRVPIVGVSGRTAANDAGTAMAAGMSAYLRKPASPADLHDALRKAAGVRRV